MAVLNGGHPECTLYGTCSRFCNGELVWRMCLFVLVISLLSISISCFHGDLDLVLIS